MAPSRRKGASKAAAAAAARRQWKVGDLVLAKVKGFPAWPAMVSEPEKWGYSSDMKKVLVYFFGTQQIAFCNPVDVEAFTEEKKESLLLKRHGKGSDFVRAVHEIIDSYEKLKKQDQVINVNSSDEATVTNENKSVESLTESGLKDEPLQPVGKSCKKFSNSGGAKNGPSLLIEGAAAVTLSNMCENEMPSEGPTCNLSVMEMARPNPYSSRRKHDFVQPQHHVMQRRAPSARRSRSSSRVDPSRFQNLVFPLKNGSKGVENLALDVLREGSERRNKQIGKSPGSSEWQEADSAAVILNGSIEENDSEIVMGDSDTHSLNEGSAVESGCKLLQPESVVECCDGDVELSQRLDFQTKSVVLRRKRKPNRKRVGNTTLEITGRLDKEASLESVVDKSEQTSPNDLEKPNDRYFKEDGDEHLPLVKRARVRMGRTSSNGEELDILMQSEEKSLSVSNGLSGHRVTLNIEDSPTYKKSLIAKGDMDNLSPSNRLSVCKSQPWEARKVEQFGCSMDGEAALPPSKRLHRALEAMSANAAEDCETPSEAPSVMKTFINGSLPSTLVDGSNMDLESKAGIEHKVDSVGNNSQDGISGLSSGLKPLMEEKSMKSSVEVVDCNRTSSIRNSPDPEPEFCKDALVSLDTAGHNDLNVAPLGDCIAEIEVVVQSPRPLSPDLGGEQACPASNQNSVNPMSPPIDDCRTENSEFSKSEKKLESGMSSDPFSSNISIACGSLQTDSNLVQHRLGGKCCDSSQLNDNNQHDERHAFMKEVNHIPKDSITSPSPTPVDAVIAAVQDTHLSHSTPVSEDHLGTQAVSGIQSSSSPIDGLDSTARASPPNTSTCDMSTSDNSNFLETNACCSPEPHLHHEKAKHTGKWSSRTEPNAALTSFETILGTLTRTKESIGRATRIAIDCAKFGSATKVVEILAHSLESESSLHRRVDFFFLVDSIAQCSRALKGNGGVYPSAIEAVLPRLLLAAAPPGSSAQENRRQCLKVLRVWQERRILPESVIRHHIRELDSFCSSSSSGAFSRRPLRTERAFDDPIREMEGMMVDEYGSNSSFQLPGFCMPPMLKDEDEGSDSDGESFEAVTPEHNPDNSEVRPRTPVSAIEKHRHILEEVDGELEMEDVAPCEAEMVFTYNITGMIGQTSKRQFEQHFHLPYAPPLPNDVPPSSPPLPTSPPPPPPPPQQLPSIPSVSGMCGPITNGFDSKLHMSTHNPEDSFQNSNLEQPVAPRVDQMISDIPHYHASESRDPHSQIQRQMPDAANCCSFSNLPASHPSIRVGNAVQQADGAVSHNKAFAVRPPYPAPSNQFSYIQSDQRLPMRRDIPPPSYSDRVHFVRNADSGNSYTDHDRMKPISRDIGESWRFSAPSFSGPRYPDSTRMSNALPPYSGPPCERSISNHRWAFPPQGMNHRELMPHRPPSEGRVHVAARAPSFWRPR